MIQRLVRTFSRTLAVGAAALSLGACETASGPDPVAPGSLLFEVEYANAAWGPVFYGAYIDAEGGVYAYDLGERRWDPADDESFTGAELMEKYSRGRERLRTLAVAEVQQRYAAVADARQGELSDLRGACADAGILRYSALVYDAATERYTRLLLHQKGDVAQTNFSPAARQLREWLDEVTENEFDYSICDPFE